MSSRGERRKQEAQRRKTCSSQPPKGSGAAPAPLLNARKPGSSKHGPLHNNSADWQRGIWVGQRRIMDPAVDMMEGDESDSETRRRRRGRAQGQTDVIAGQTDAAAAEKQAATTAPDPVLEAEREKARKRYGRARG